MFPQHVIKTISDFNICCIFSTLIYLCKTLQIEKSWTRTQYVSLVKLSLRRMEVLLKLCIRSVLTILTKKPAGYSANATGLLPVPMTSMFTRISMPSSLRHCSFPISLLIPVTLWPISNGSFSAWPSSCGGTFVFWKITSHRCNDASANAWSSFVRFHNLKPQQFFIDSACLVTRMYVKPPMILSA